MNNVSLCTRLFNCNEKKPNNKENQSKDQQEKVLCTHCGRTSNNDIRCLGICVADNDY